MVSKPFAMVSEYNKECKLASISSLEYALYQNGSNDAEYKQEYLRP